MLGSSISAVSWPACGEIDIMELLGHEPETVYGTAHWFQGSLQSKGNRFDLAGNSDFSDGYHIFSLLWEENRLVWYVDFNKFFELRKNITDTSWPFNAPFFFILNVAVGGNWPGDPDASTSFPQTMSVDYIRVYQPGG
jgi:beta-glucanase (GH16 family)